MRILHIVPHVDSRFGGIFPAVLKLAASMAHRHQGVTSEIVVLCRPWEKDGSGQVAGISVVRYDASWWSAHFIPIAFLFWRRGKGVDVIHVHGLWCPHSIAAAVLARVVGAKLIVSPHGMLDAWALNSGKIKKLLYWNLVAQWVFRSASLIHALTNTEQADIDNVCGKCPVAVIPNMVEERARAPRYSAEPNSVRTIVYLSRIHPKKGLDILIRAIAKVHASGLQVRLIVAGSGDAHYCDELVQLGESLNLKSVLDWRGHVESRAKDSVLAEADCFALISHSEGLSVAMLEAMSAGLPVIVSPQCNLLDVESLGAGWICDTDVDAAYQKVRAFLLTKDDRLANMSRSAVALVKKRFSEEVVAKLWSSHLLALRMK